MTARQTLRNLDLQQIETIFEREQSHTQRDLPSSFESEGEDCFQWLPQLSPKISRLEIRAALNMSINTIPFWICTFPITCNGIALYWCIRFETNCSVIVGTNPYFRAMFLLHVIYNPVMHMFTSLEFRRALKRLIQKWFPVI